MQVLKRVLIIGAYGNFGRFIARELAAEKNIQLILAGRNKEKAEQLAATLEFHVPPECVRLDISVNFSEALNSLRPDVVIHTSGPYQNQSYRVAEACIAQACHYIDLADARDFVADIYKLDADAKKAGVLICAGASSVPCLTAAIVDRYKIEFEILETLEYCISTAQQTSRGLATTSAILSYAGKPFYTLINGENKEVYGWLGLGWRKFWGLGLRPMGYCDIPDLSIFPQRYPGLKNIQFKAGLEIKIIHLTLTGLAYLVKMGWIKSLQAYAKVLLRLSHFFDMFGTDDSGFYMNMLGRDSAGENYKVLFELQAKRGEGLYIPAMPSILLTKKLAAESMHVTGASPCVGLLSLDEYLAGLSKFNIEWRVLRNQR